MKRTLFPWMIAGALIVTVRAVPAQEVQPRLTFEAHTGSARSGLLTPDDKFLITRGERRLRGLELVGDNAVKMWDLSTGKERVLSKLAGEAIALSPDGKVLALADDRSVRLWDIVADKEIAVFKEHGSAVGAVAFSPDGKTLAAGWNKPGPKPGRKVAVATLWDVATGKQAQTLDPSPGPVRVLAFSPDGRILAVATQDFPLIGDVTLWEVSIGKVRSTLESNGVDCLAFSPDGKTLAAGCLANYHNGKKENNHVRLWDVANAKDLHYLRHEGRVYCVAFAADGKTLASGSEHAELKLWDVPSGKMCVALPTQSHYVLSVAFAKNGKALVTTTGDGLVKCWDTPKILDRKADK